MAARTAEKRRSRAGAAPSKGHPTAERKSPGRQSRHADGAAGAREAAKDWYSIGEAAEYLGVSEPTIYRWMKDELLSFYKVGGSTRFAKEGLDAVIEKTTGRKEAEAVAARCAACGHGVLVGGRLQGTGRLYFRPEKTKFWVFAESLVGLRARVCTACGFVQLHADTEKLKKLKPGEKK